MEDGLNHNHRSSLLHLTRSGMVRAQSTWSVDTGVLFESFELYSRLLKVQIQTTARHGGCFCTNHISAVFGSLSKIRQPRMGIKLQRTYLCFLPPPDYSRCPTCVAIRASRGIAIPIQRILGCGGILLAERKLEIRFLCPQPNSGLLSDASLSYGQHSLGQALRAAL